MFYFGIQLQLKGLNAFTCALSKATLGDAPDPADAGDLQAFADTWAVAATNGVTLLRDRQEALISFDQSPTYGPKLALAEWFVKLLDSA